MRCAVMDYVLTPLAAWAGVQKKKTKVRFAEQAWILLYYGAFWSCGMVSLAKSPTKSPCLISSAVHYVPLNLLAQSSCPLARLADT